MGILNSLLVTLHKTISEIGFMYLRRFYFPRPLGVL